MKTNFSVLLVGAFAVLSACGSNQFGGDANPSGVTPTPLGASNTSPISGGGFAAPNSPAFFSQTVGDRVLFPVDQDTLTDEGKAILQGQAQWLNQNPQYMAVIEGHADEQGTREYNIALGAKRARAVQAFLIANGVAPQRLTVLSFGKERPIAICSSEECYSQNRRALTVLSGG